MEYVLIREFGTMKCSRRTVVAVPSLDAARLAEIREAADSSEQPWITDDDPILDSMEFELLDEESAKALIQRLGDKSFLLGMQ
jgi:hypothetical protein